MQTRMNRRDFARMTGTGAVGFWLSSTAATAEETRRPPNIILILADDLGYGDLGCYGQRRIKTPNLDAMAAEGIRFTSFYSGSTVCAPSRCSLMTGLHTGHARIRGNLRVPLEPGDVILPEVLKKAGYATALVGKWGLGEKGTTGIPNRKGFDEFYGYLNQAHAHNYYPEFLWHNQETVEFFGNPYLRKEYTHDLFTEKALEWVRASKDAPFFLYLAYTIPHANNEAGVATGDGMQVPDYGIYKDKDWPNVEKGKAAMISRMDGDIGKLRALLEELGIAENTLILFSSDNGTHREGNSDPEFFHSSGALRGIKRDLYEGGIRVPMIACQKGAIPAGTLSEHVWAAWDLLPTLAELVGAPPPSGIDGLSMLPALYDKPAPQHEFLYWEFHEKGFHQAVRMGEWKAVRLGKDKPIELFNLYNDPGESLDVSASNPEVVAKIENYLKTARTESEHWKVD